MEVTGLGWGIVLTAFLFGFRHGFDLDHLAAIADITGSQSDTRRSLALSSLYAVGHALVVFVLGTVAIVAGAYIPTWVDAMMGRVIGVTLVALGAYLLYAVARHGAGFRMRSRWMLVLSGLRRVLARFRTPQAIVIEHDHEHAHAGPHDHHHPSAVPGPPSGPVMTATRTHRHTHRHVATMPVDPFESYGPVTAVGIGMLHGVGAETPTQVLLFATAAGVGSATLGLVVLALFVGGLVVANTIVAAAATMGFLNGARSPRLYVALALVTAAFSIALGIGYLS